MTKPLVRLILATQLFLLIALTLLPLLIHYLQHPLGRFLYAILVAGSILLAVLSRRALTELV